NYLVATDLRYRTICYLIGSAVRSADGGAVSAVADFDRDNAVYARGVRRTLNLELAESSEARRRPGEDHRRFDSAEYHSNIHYPVLYITYDFDQSVNRQRVIPAR